MCKVEGLEEEYRGRRGGEMVRKGRKGRKITIGQTNRSVKGTRKE
jgi:hypothetical protein